MSVWLLLGSEKHFLLNIRLKETTSGRQIEYPMVSNQNTYMINLSALEPGVYNFEVSANKKSHRAFGSFEILNFNIEQQVKKMGSIIFIITLKKGSLKIKLQKAIGRLLTIMAIMNLRIRFITNR